MADDYPLTSRFDGFQRRADEFLKAYKEAGPAFPPNWPKYFLGCHAVELELKVFLLSKGFALEKLEKKPYGHNLTILIGEAVSNGLAISQVVQKDIKALAQVHEKHWHRYPMESGDPVLLIEQFDSSIDSMFDAVRSAVFGRHMPMPLSG